MITICTDIYKFPSVEIMKKMSKVRKMPRYQFITTNCHQKLAKQNFGYGTSPELHHRFIIIINLFCHILKSNCRHTFI